MIVAIHEPGYDINRKNSDLWLGNRPYIQMILTPTVPIIESIIGTVEYPIPLSAPGKRSMIPHRKYGIVVIEIISSPDLITSLLLVYMPSICVPNIFIISIMILLGKEKIRKNVIIALINISSIMIFGGRMAGVVSLCMIIVSLIYSSNINSRKKILVYFLTI